MASSSVAAPRRRVTAQKSTKQSEKLQVVRVAPVPAVEVVHGNNRTATAKGVDAVAVAVGKDSHAISTMEKDSLYACAVAAGSSCTAELNGDGCSDGALAVGAGSHAISNVAGAPSIAVGYAAFAEASEASTAIAIGFESAAQADEGGYLVFVDTSESRKPSVAVFAVDEENGIWPNVPYYWKEGMTMPCPDWDRIERDAFMRGQKYQRKHSNGR